MPDRRRVTAIIRHLVVASALLGTVPQVAHAISVSPVRIHFTGKDRVVTLSIGNEATREVAVQTELFRWTQKVDGTDVLEPADDIVVSPPILKVAPGGRKSIRLARMRRGELEQQASYRLFVHELPAANAAEAEEMAVQFTTSFSVPLFVPPRAPRKDLMCRAAERDAIECHNGGNAHVQIRQLVVQRQTQPVATAAGSHYLLPGATKRLPLTWRGPSSAGPASLSLELDDGTSQITDMVLP